MSAFDDLTYSVTTKYNNKIRKSCSALFDSFSLSQFFYYKIENNGFFLLLDSSVEWSEFYSAQKFYLIDPYFRHPQHFQSGIVLLKDVQDENLKSILNTHKIKFQQNVILKILQKNGNSVETFGFCSTFSDESYLSFLLSQVPLLQMFAEKFRKENRMLFDRLQDNQIDFTQLIGKPFYENGLLELETRTKRKNFLQKMGIEQDLSLTTKEIHTVRLMLQGYSAAKIASQNYLSKRTIEHQIERIKNKLGCESKTELIQKTRELERLGHLDIV